MTTPHRSRTYRSTAASEVELRKRYAALVHGREVSMALFGWDPEREGW